ncbi:MAG TPA: DNA topology modulation protein [Crinalium sp.]|jgi:adenylate kinase family enzyme
MRKILILGSGGAGKSTLARAIAQTLQLEVIHLDAHYWQAGWVESSPEEWQKTVEILLQKESWVMDGNYGGTLDLRLSVADTIIFLDMPRLTCLWRIVKRRLQYAGKTRPDMASDCPEQLNWEFIRYVWSYPDRRRRSILEKLRARPTDQTVIVLRSPTQVRDFLRSLNPTTVIPTEQ